MISTIAMATAEGFEPDERPRLIDKIAADFQPVAVPPRRRATFRAVVRLYMEPPTRPVVLPTTSRSVLGRISSSRSTNWRNWPTSRRRPFSASCV